MGREEWGLVETASYHSREDEKPGAAGEEGKGHGGASKEVGSLSMCSREVSQDEAPSGAEGLGRSSFS